MAGDLTAIVLSLLTIMGVESALDSRTVAIHRVSVAGPVSSSWGAHADALEEKLKDEAYRVMREAYSRKEPARISTPNADGSVESLARGVGLQRLMIRLQQATGNLEYAVTAEILVEKEKAILEIRAKRYDKQVVRARVERPMDQLNELIEDGGWALVRLFDPHIACAAVLRRSMEEGRVQPGRTLDCVNNAIPTSTEADRPWLYNLQGVGLTLQGRRAEAIKSFAHALKLEPDFSLPLLNLGVLLAANGQHEEAIKAYETVFRKRLRSDAPQIHAAAYAMWALSLEKLGRSAETLPMLRKAIRTDLAYDLPPRLLLERLPSDSAEAGELRKIIAELGDTSGDSDWKPVYTDNLVGVMPLKDLFADATK